MFQLAKLSYATDMLVTENKMFLRFGLCFVSLLVVIF